MLSGCYLSNMLVSVNPADKDLETMFTKELKRRGLDSIDDLGGWTPADEGEQLAATGCC